MPPEIPGARPSPPHACTGHVRPVSHHCAGPLPQTVQRKAQAAWPRVGGSGKGVIQAISKILTVGFDLVLNGNYEVDYLSSTLSSEYKVGHLESIAKMAKARGIKPERLEYADLSQVGMTDTLTLTGHGDTNTMSYDAKTLAARLSGQGLKQCGELELLGCKTGQQLKQELLNELTYTYQVKVGSGSGSTTMVRIVNGVPQSFTESAQKDYDRITSAIQQAEFFGDQTKVNTLKAELNTLLSTPTNFTSQSGSQWSKSTPDLIKLF